jgi:hypothetical protein
LLVEFTSVVDALRSATEIQNAMAERSRIAVENASNFE